MCAVLPRSSTRVVLDDLGVRERDTEDDHARERGPVQLNRIAPRCGRPEVPSRDSNLARQCASVGTAGEELKSSEWTFAGRTRKSELARSIDARSANCETTFEARSQGKLERAKSP